jgi:hypothetical protein
MLYLIRIWLTCSNNLLLTPPKDMGIEELRPPELEDKIVWANNFQIGVVSNKLRTK